MKKMRQFLHCFMRVLHQTRVAFIAFFAGFLLVSNVFAAPTTCPDVTSLQWVSANTDTVCRQSYSFNDSDELPPVPLPTEFLHCTSGDLIQISTDGLSWDADNFTVENCVYGSWEIKFYDGTTTWTEPTINYHLGVMSTVFSDVFELFYTATGERLPFENHTFSGITNDIKYRFRDGIERWGDRTRFDQAFHSVKTLERFETPNDWGNITNLGYSFLYSGVKYVDFSNGFGNITSFGGTFESARSLDTFIFPESGWGNVVSASYMFASAPMRDIVNFPTEWGDKMTSVQSMFSGAQFTEINLPNNWNNILSVKNMFRSVRYMPSITLPDSWGKVRNANGMFVSATNVAEIKLKNSLGVEISGLGPNTLPNSWGEITDAAYMFYGVSALDEIHIPDDWGAVTNASYMFQSTGIDEIDLPSSWANVQNTRFMFARTGLDYIVLPDTWGMITDKEAMFTNTGFIGAGDGLTNADDPAIPIGMIASPDLRIFPAQLYAENLGVGSVVPSCAAGYYLVDEACQPVGEDYYGAGGWSDRVRCPVGSYTAGFGVMANASNDCGRLLNVQTPEGENKKVHLSISKRTIPALHVNVEGRVYYGQMVPDSDKGFLRLNYDGVTYSVIDDSM